MSYLAWGINKRLVFGSEGLKRSVFIRVHFVLRPVRSYILAIFWYCLGPSVVCGLSGADLDRKAKLKCILVHILCILDSGC